MTDRVTDRDSKDYGAGNAVGLQPRPLEAIVARLGLSPLFVYLKRERYTNFKSYAFLGGPDGYQFDF